MIGCIWILRASAAEEAAPPPQKWRKKVCSIRLLVACRPSVRFDQSMSNSPLSTSALWLQAVNTAQVESSCRVDLAAKTCSAVLKFGTAGAARPGVFLSIAGGLVTARKFGTVGAARPSLFVSNAGGLGTAKLCSTGGICTARRRSSACAHGCLARPMAWGVAGPIKRTGASPLPEKQVLGCLLAEDLLLILQQSLP